MKEGGVKSVKARKKEKLGLEIGNYKLYQLSTSWHSISLSFKFFFTFHQIHFVFFFVIL
jgi:hypothetical protein